MTTYVAELYDKDNDHYTIIAASDNEMELRKRCRIIEHLLRQDMIVHCKYNDKTMELDKEPYDSINIRTVMPGETIDTYNLFLC